MRPTDDLSPPAPCCDACGSRAVSLHAVALCPRCALTLALAAGEEAEELPRELFPELEIEGPVGSGAFGRVRKARHRRLQRAVALKSLDHLRARSAENRDLFAGEMAAVGRLDHPGIVRAHDAGERDGHWFIMTEFIDGTDTGALVRRHGRLPVAEACETVRQAAVALHYAHGCGLVHRDVKPGNIMITSGADGPCRVKVLDFGLAAAAGAEASAGGTPGYMAPETMRPGAVADVRADVYALGATLWRFLAGPDGRVTTGAERTLAGLRAKSSDTSDDASGTARASAPAMPAKLAELCARCVATDPAERPASAAKVAELLAPWAHGAELARLFGDGPLPERPRATWLRRHPRAAGAGLAAVLLLAAGLAWWGHGRRTTAAAPGEVGWPVFSPALLAERQLTPDIAPRLLTDEWVPDLEIPVADPVAAARFLPDGAVIHLYDGPVGVEIRTHDHGRTESSIPLGKRDDVKVVTMDPGSGRVLWTQLNDPRGLHLGRAEANGALLPGLRFDFAPEFPAGAFELVRQALLKQGEEVSDATPWGLATVLAGELPVNTDLQPGDTLIADAGHRNFGVMKSRPGLWRCRADADAPAERLGLLPVDDHFPLDVTVSRRGVYLLNRGETMPSQPESNPWNKESRLYRWDREGFHRCLLRQPLHDPSGLAADPLSADLYAIQGALLPSASTVFQRVLRLHPVAADEYEVTPVADRFGKFSPCGIAFSADGKRLLLTDVGNRVIVGLRRKGGQK